MKKDNLFRIIRLVALLLSFVTLNSCDTDLVEELKSELSESNISSESDAIALVDGVYNGLLYDGWEYYASGVMARATDGITDVFDISDIHYMTLETYDWSDEDIVEPLWTSMFRVIDRANWAVELIEDLDEDVFTDVTKESLIAEAKFLRGLAYFDLTGMFGAVPLKLAPTKTDEEGLARSPIADVYAQIELDFQYGTENLPVDNGSPGKASKGAAYGLLAKTQLRQLKWEEAGASIDSLIDLGKFDLFTEAPVMELFYESNVLDNEFIFSVLSLGESYGIASNHHMKFFTPWNYDAGWAEVGIPEAMLSSIEEGDERLSLYFDYFPNIYTTRNVSSILNYGKAINRKFSSLNRDVTSPGTSYASVMDNYGISKLGVPILRYADVLLLKAEIENQLNGGPTAAAYTAINAVRNRSGLADLTSGLGQDDFKTAVLKERAVELAAEGHRKDDLIRNGVFVSTMTQYLSDQGYPVAVTEDHQLMPIPRAELNLNPNIEPNPSNNF